jgi:hypothetical protein
VLLNALKSITAEDLANTNEKNLDKLQKSGVYPLLKIMNNLTDDEIKVVAKNLEDFKTISDKAEAFIIPELINDIKSSILMQSFEDLHQVFGGKDLTSKLISNLLEIPPVKVNKRRVDPVTTPPQNEGPSRSPQWLSCFNLLAKKLYKTAFGSPTEDKVGVNSAVLPVQNEQPSSSPKATGCFNFMAMFSSARSSR